MRKRVSKTQLKEAEFVRAIDKNTKIDHCFLCERKMTSACDSHIVPQFVLKEIAEDGHVSYGYALLRKTVHGVEKTTGIKNAHNFRLICRDCDNRVFKHYEDPNNIDSFASLPPNERKIVLCEMAIKTHLAHVSMKYRELVGRDMLHGGRLGTLEKEGKAVFGERIDMEEHEELIRAIQKDMKTNRNPFVVLFEKTLDYKTKLAAQTVINYSYDLTGKQVFDNRLVTYENAGRYFYLMVLPRKEKTHVLFFLHKKDLPYVQGIVNQFQELSEDEKLHFLFVSLIIHDEQFYMSPSLASMIFKKDRKIVKLYNKTVFSDECKSKIKDFRKYTNYLSQKYNQ